MTFSRIRLTAAEAQAQLAQGRWGVLSTADASGQPYGVPINYVYDPQQQLIYCHCAAAGQKLANIAVNSQVSFTVVAEEHILEEAFVSNYRSVIVQGRAEIYTDPAQMERPLALLCAALAPSTTAKQRKDVIARYLAAVRIIAIHIERLTGKENHDT